MSGLAPKENFLTKSRNLFSAKNSHRRVKEFVFSFSENWTFLIPIFLQIKTERGFQTCQLRGRICYLHESLILGSTQSTRSFNDVTDYIPSLNSEDHESSISSAKPTGGQPQKHSFQRPLGLEAVLRNNQLCNFSKSRGCTVLAEIATTKNSSFLLPKSFT